MNEGPSRRRRVAVGVENEGRVLAALPTVAPGLTYVEIAGVVGLTYQAVKYHLDGLLMEGRATRSGAGTRGQPFRFRRRTA